MARPSFAISDGLVVTPSTMPHAAAFFSLSRFAVSRKNFIWQYPPLKSQCSSNYRATPRRRVPITLVVAGGFEMCCKRPAVAAPQALDPFSDMIDIDFVQAARTHHSALSFVHSKKSMPYRVLVVTAMNVLCLPPPPSNNLSTSQNLLPPN